MIKKKMYIVFDQIPSKSSGGLVATYINLSKLLKNEYDIEIISVFECDEESKEQFKNNKINVINKRIIDIRFYKVLSHIKSKQFKKTVYCIFSAVYYFIKIPFSKLKMRKLISDDDRVVVSCPSAAIFMSKKKKFILELHINYKYFFGNNTIGKLQSLLMSKPSLSLFRSKDDSMMVPKKLNPNYIYNFFDNSNIERSKKLVKNKIVFLGRLNEVKQPIKMIELAYKLSKINKNFTLDIYGDGPLKEEIINKIKELKLEKKVFLKGFTTDKNIYKNYSLLWLTSSVEGLPMVIIEAKANGIPTISTNWGNAVYEVIKDKEDGYVTNNDDKFVELTNDILTNEKLQKKLCDNAYKNFDNFSKEKAKERWIYFLENYKK